MQLQHTHTHENAIYPGGYEPMMTENDTTGMNVQPQKSAMKRYLPKITDLKSLFRIELPVPGVLREEFFIDADENELSVRVVHKAPVNKRLPGQPIDFGAGYVDHHIVLPEDADTEFACAEYKAGILRMHFPKTKHSLKNRHTRIVVY